MCWHNQQVIYKASASACSSDGRHASLRVFWVFFSEFMFIKMWWGEKKWTTLKPHGYVAHMISVSLLHELSFDCEASLNKRDGSFTLRATATLLSGRAGDGERCWVQKQQRPQHVCISKGVEAGHFISRPLVLSGLTVVNIDSFLKASRPWWRYAACLI